MSNHRYAIWYEPTGTVYEELKSVIIGLAEKYKTSFSEPHITLLPGGTDLPKETVISKLQKVVSNTKSFSTKFTSYGCADDYFRCIYINILQNPEIMHFAHAIHEEFNSTQNIFTPHLSILYGELPITEKDKIIKSLGGTYEKSFILEKVDIIEYEFGKSPESWRKIQSIKIN